MTGLDISFTSAHDALVARLDGEVDITNTVRLSDAILEAFSNRLGMLVLDLTGVRYLDSAGIRTIFEVASTLETSRQQLAVVAPEGSSLRRLFAITNVSSVARVASSVDEAMRPHESSPPHHG